MRLKRLPLAGVFLNGPGFILFRPSVSETGILQHQKNKAAYLRDTCRFHIMTSNEKRTDWVGRTLWNGMIQLLQFPLL